MSINIDGNNCSDVTIDGQNAKIITADGTIVFNNTDAPYVGYVDLGQMYLHSFPSNIDVFSKPAISGEWSAPQWAVAITSTKVAYPRDENTIHIVDRRTGALTDTINFDSSTYGTPYDLEMTDDYLIMGNEGGYSTNDSSVRLYNLNNKTFEKTIGGLLRVNGASIDSTQTYYGYVHASKYTVRRLSDHSTVIDGTTNTDMYDIDIHNDNGTAACIFTGENVITGPFGYVDYEGAIDSYIFGGSINQDYYAYSDYSNDKVVIKETISHDHVQTYDIEGPADMEMNSNYMAVASETYAEIYLVDLSDFSTESIQTGVGREQKIGLAEN